MERTILVSSCSVSPRPASSDARSTSVAMSTRLSVINVSVSFWIVRRRNARSQRWIRPRLWSYSRARSASLRSRVNEGQARLLKDLVVALHHDAKLLLVMRGVGSSVVCVGPTRALAGRHYAGRGVLRQRGQLFPHQRSAVGLYR